MKKQLILFFSILLISFLAEAQVKEYYITCDPSDFIHIYQNFNEDIYIPISLSFQGTTWENTRMRIRGDGTRSLPKKSLKVVFDSIPFSNERNAINFNAEYDDKSYIHQYLTSRLMKESGQVCFDSEHARLYLNDEFLGLYLLIENIDEDFLTSNELDKDGNLYKATLDGACLSVYDNVYYHWEKKTNESSEWDDLINLIQIINSTPDDIYYDLVNEIFYYEKMINIIAMNLLCSNSSTYYHNYYMYHDIENSGKWEMLPWDLDKTFARYGDNIPFHRSSSHWSPDNPFLERAILCETVFEDIKNRMDDLTATIFNENNIFPIIDSLKTILLPSVTEDTTDNILDTLEWFSILDNECSYTQVRYNNLQYQINNYPISFKVKRTNGLFTSEVQLSWLPSFDPNGNDISYNLYYGKTMNKTGLPDSIIAGIIDTSYLLTDIQEEGLYYWKVSVTDGVDEVDGFDNYNYFVINSDNSKIVISEINYNSSPDFNTEDWIEFYNPEAYSVDISSWFFKDSQNDNVFTFPEGTIISSNDYLVLCKNRSQFSSLFPDVSNCIGDFQFGLSGSGELIRLYHKHKNLIDSVVYDDKLPWPTEADGNGPTLELINAEFDNSLPESWVASSDYGTPGKSNNSSVPFIYNTHLFLRNSPNPFRTETIINYSISKAGKIQLFIIDVHEQIAGKLVDEFLPAGNYSIKWKPENCRSGLFLINLKIDNISVKTLKAVYIQ